MDHHQRIGERGIISRVKIRWLHKIDIENMNIVDFFRNILKMNKDFDEAQINRYIAYFQEQTKAAFSPYLREYLTTNYYNYKEYIEGLIKEGETESYYEVSDTYGYDGLELRGIYDKKGNLLATDVITNDQHSLEERLIFRAKGLEIWSLKDSEANDVFYKGIALCLDKDGKYGLIDKFGEILCAPYYDFIDSFPVGNYLVAYKDDFYGVIDFKGKEVVPLIYETILIEPDHFMHETYLIRHGYATDYFILHKDEKYGLMNKELEVVFPTEYKAIFSLQKEYGTYYQEDVYFVLENTQGKFAFYHPKEDYLSAFDYDEIFTGKHCNLVPFRKGNKKGFYNIKAQTETFVDFDFHLSAFNDQFKHYLQIQNKALEKYAVFNLKLERLTEFAFKNPVNFDRRDEVILFSDWEGNRLNKEEFFRLYGI